jgi:hypothetical protein
MAMARNSHAVSAISRFGVGGGAPFLPALP